MQPAPGYQHTGGKCGRGHKGEKECVSMVLVVGGAVQRWCWWWCWLMVVVGVGWWWWVGQCREVQHRQLHQHSTITITTPSPSPQDISIAPSPGEHGALYSTPPLSNTACACWWPQCPLDQFREARESALHLQSLLGMPTHAYHDSTGADP